MPRKQVSRRRKGRKNVQYDFKDAPVTEVATEDDSEESYDDAGDEAPGAAFVRTNAPDAPRERHVSRDYTHVRNEVVRIVIMGGVLLIAIVIAGFFR